MEQQVVLQAHNWVRLWMSMCLKTLNAKIVGMRFLAMSQLKLTLILFLCLNGIANSFLIFTFTDNNSLGHA